MSKRNPEDILKQLDKPASAWGRPDSDGDEDMDAVLAMSDEEVEAELVGHGVDVGALDAKAEALVAGAATATATVVPLRSRSRRWMKWVPLAVAAGTGGAIGLSQLLETIEPVTMVASGRDAGAESQNQRAARALREDAGAACNRKEWAACLSLLDRAAKLDPSGDRQSEATRLRRIANEGASEAGGTE